MADLKIPINNIVNRINKVCAIVGLPLDFIRGV